MRRVVVLFLGMFAIVAIEAEAKEGSLNKIPSAWKWISPTEVAFSFDGTYADPGAFVTGIDGLLRYSVPASAREVKTLAEKLTGIENPTLSPDKTLMAYTKWGDLYVRDVATGRVVRLTDDGYDYIYNGYAAWVY